MSVRNHNPMVLMLKSFREYRKQGIEWNRAVTMVAQKFGFGRPGEALVRKALIQHGEYAP